MRDAKGEFNDLNAALNVAARVSDRLAMLTREAIGEFIVVLGDEIEELHQYAGAALRIGRRPAQLSLFGVFDGRPDFALRSQRHFGAHRSIHGLKDVALTA